MLRGGSFGNNFNNVRCAARNHNNPDNRNDNNGFRVVVSTFFDSGNAWRGNVYLGPLDHCIKRELRCAGYVRYVDDLLLFADDKAVLWSWLQAMRQRLALLRLTLHPGAHPRPVTEGIPFLGFTVFPERRRLKRRKGIQFQAKLRSLLQAWQAGIISTDQLVASIDGWVNHARYGNTVGLRKKMLSAVPDAVLQLVSHLDG